LARLAQVPAGAAPPHHCHPHHHTAPNKTHRQPRAFPIHFMNPGTRSLRDMEYLDVSFEQPMLRMRV
ncbi:MAG: hypothetical protein OXC27_01255, partial [Caldilineaceae bacterium]|nr:hypothetical protein [Caldilineaceae bacterium]